jgi:hypothetical protein
MVFRAVGWAALQLCAGTLGVAAHSCSGRFEVVVLFGMLRLAAQFVYWSRIVSGLNQEHA